MQEDNRLSARPQSPSGRAKRKGGLGEMNFCPSVLFGWWVCVTEGGAQVSRNFAQKWFVLRPVIAIKFNSNPGLTC